MTLLCCSKIKESEASRRSETDTVSWLIHAEERNRRRKSAFTVYIAVDNASSWQAKVYSTQSPSSPLLALSLLHRQPRGRKQDNTVLGAVNRK